MCGAPMNFTNWRRPQEVRVSALAHHQGKVVRVHQEALVIYFSIIDMMFLFAFISQDVLLVVHRAAGVEDGPAQCSAQGCLANVRWSRHGSNFTKNVLLWERAVAADGACVAQDQHTACFKNVPVSFSMRASFFSFGYRLLLERGRKQGENVAPLHFLMSHPSSFPQEA